MTRSLGIRGRVIGLAMVPVAIIGILLMFQLIAGKIDDLDQSLRTRGLAIARQLAPATEYGVASGNTEVLQTLLEKAAIEPDVRVVARLYDPVREDTYHTLGLMETVCPTVIGSDKIHEIITGNGSSAKRE